ncbi:integrator complex subunit 9 [Lepeophtheirus salmonis]|nr:integrator complex subunit 9-like [Lepeophtheirus salmonis]
MKLYRLSNVANKPCYVLNFKGVRIMLDCGLDLSTALHYLPIPLVHSQKLSNLGNYVPGIENMNFCEGELKDCNGKIFVDSSPEFCTPHSGLFDFADIDVILISNYTCMLALPYVTEESGFKGIVYMTEPTLHIGRLFMEETIEYMERTALSSRHSSSGSWKDILHALPPPLCDVSNPRSWKRIYNRKQMESSLSKVQLMGYSEKKDVFGLLTVSPVSSGYCLGSSNWIISSGFEKIGYVSGTSTLTTHPRPLNQIPLRNVDCLIMTSLTQTPTQMPDPMIGEFCKSVVETTRLGGNVLVPCYPSGITYDLFECLAGQMDAHSLCTIPMYFVSPVADSSLAYSNIMAEWLSQSKQNKVYLPEEPFPHGGLARNGRLKSFRTMHDENFSNEYRQPCIMFCGHPSLRFGEVIHFIELWGSNSNNTIVFTEPSFPYEAALAPFQPLHMKVIHCPIDTSLNFSQAKKLIRDLKPGSIAIPEEYSLPPLSSPNRTDLTIDADIPIKTIGRYENIKLPIQVKYEKITIEPSLASSLFPFELRPGVSVATITGDLSVIDNKYKLKDIIDSKPEIGGSRKRKYRELNYLSLKSRHPKEYLFGKLDVNTFMERLTSSGVSGARLEDTGSGTYVIHLESEGCYIKIDGHKTDVFCDDSRSKNKIRRRVREAVINCINKF